MTAITNFIPTIDPYAAVEHYLKVESSEGRELFLKSFSTEQELQNVFNEIKISKKGYPPLLFTVFPVCCGSYDTLTQFFQSFFIPQTLVVLPSLESRIEKVVIGVFTLIYDMITLPLRAITAIPYVTYNKFFNTEEEHKIIALIRDNPLAAHALSEGKVIIRAITENFSEIQPGSVNGKLIFKVNGTISEKATDVHINRPLYAGDMNSSEGSHGYNSFCDETIQTRYRVFQQPIISKGFLEKLSAKSSI